MMALQPADAPAPAVCSLVALEGHDGRGALKWPLLHTLRWDPVRGSDFEKKTTHKRTRDLYYGG